MVTEPFHGARVFQSGDDPVFVSFVSTATVGLLVAVDPADLPAGVSIDEPIHIEKAADAALLPAAVREEIDSVYDQTAGSIIVVMIDEGADAAALTANAVGDATALTGIHALKKATALGMPKPKLLAAPGLTTAGVPDGIASVAVTTPGTGYDDTTTVTVSGSTGGQGAVLTPVIGPGGAIDSIIVEKPGYGYSGVLTVTISGPGTGGAATASAGAVLNAVIAEAQGIAEDLRAQFYADGPDGTSEQAVAARALIGSKRVCYSDPRVLKSIDGVPTPKSSSTIFAALQSKMDRERGAHWPGSNVLINGIQGTNRPVLPGSEASNLNENGVNTIINRGDGFRAWGPMTCAVGTIWEFVSVVRVADLVNESIEKAFVQFNDRPQSRLALDQMAMAGRAALKSLEAEGVLLPGSEFGLSSTQSAADGVQGIVKFAMRYEPPAPIYDIRIAAYRNPTVAYELLYDSVSGTIDTGDLL
ncbi:phage tail sheath subtilisin-like domain-containing protein [Limimaricola hongkongensis]|uniref:Tail sheath protein subtilisin-like domain-containing protein n=1 Tax=Limimaricola hongkongensis DSM 17492 TaxID=1122180 RepID=A0A017HDD9_9RHOB|nr:phage tail sheath subtilisin-like domain-containing protein [Limimaricola hongkongensis]EYD71814.1 hypothetical protein Lokhon_01884 [Limimaricola hongkongensis DSM 17492]